MPALSSVALARARMRWSAESTEVVTLVGRDPHLVARSLAPGLRLLVLSSDGSTPGEVAALLTAAGYGASPMTVLADLGSADGVAHVDGVAASWGDEESPRSTSSRSSWSARAPARSASPPDCPTTPSTTTARSPSGTSAPPRWPGSRRCPASCCGTSAPAPVRSAIEWMRAHPTCRAIAVEAREDRAERIVRNASTLGVPALRGRDGPRPRGARRPRAPHAIFVGGGATEPGLLDACWDALRPGGRLVVHGVTLRDRGGPGPRYAGWAAS